MRRKTANPTASPPTLDVVARAAGVSASTVSRIINGTANVSDARRRAVEEAIASCNFRPNPTARGLAMGRSMTIGVVTQAIDSPFYGEGMRGIEHHLQQHGYAALFMSGNWNAEDEQRCFAELLARRVDGIIVFSGAASDTTLASCATKVPVVITGRRLKMAGVYSLPIDDREGAALATHHLIGLGHRRIGFIAGQPDHPDANERLAGYRKALSAAGVEFDPQLVVAGDFHEEGGLDSTLRLLEAQTPFTALFCVNDQSAYGACLALYRKGLRIPEDVSVVGFDDLPSSAYRLPPLTTVRQSVRALGESSAEAMLQLLGGSRPRIRLPQIELVVRESTREPRAEPR